MVIYPQILVFWCWHMGGSLKLGSPKWIVLQWNIPSINGCFGGTHLWNPSDVSTFPGPKTRSIERIQGAPSTSIHALRSDLDEIFKEWYIVNLRHGMIGNPMINIWIMYSWLASRFFRVSSSDRGCQWLSEKKTVPQIARKTGIWTIGESVWGHRSRHKGSRGLSLVMRKSSCRLEFSGSMVMVCEASQARRTDSLAYDW